MAACLVCGHPRARVLESRTVKLERIAENVRVMVRQCWRIVACPVCGERRRQLVTDEGEAVGWIKKVPSS